MIVRNFATARKGGEHRIDCSMRSVFDKEIAGDDYDPGRTHQSFAKDADINNIMAKYSRTGVLGDPSRPVRQAVFGDFSGLDFQSDMNRLMDARERFMQLPSDIRNRFNNDPGELIDFVSDPANVEEAVSLGLLSSPASEGEETAPEPAPAPAPATAEGGDVAVPAE